MAESFGWATLGAGEKRSLAQLIARDEAPAAPRLLELQLTAPDGRVLPWLLLEERLPRLADDGLRALRLTGQPFLHPDIDRILHCVSDLGLVIDEVELPAGAVSPERLAPLLGGLCHQVTVPLTSFDAADFSRLTGRPAADHPELVRTAEALLARRPAEDRPTIVGRYRFDRPNHRHLVRMLWHGRDIGCDRIALVPLQEGELHAGEPLTEVEGEALHPLLDVILSDAAASRAEFRFPFRSWRVMLAERRHHHSVPDPLRPPPSEGQGGEKQCFFGWYAARVDASCNVHPCPKLTVEPPLGTLAERLFAAGPVAAERRREQLEVLLAGGRLFHDSPRFQRLAPRCVEAGACGLKSRYFAHDETFYAKLDGELAKARQRSPVAARLGRELETLAYRTVHGVRARLPRRSAAATRSSSGRRIRLHVGSGKEWLAGWLNVDLQVLPFVDLVGDLVRGLPIVDGIAECIYAEHFLEHIRVDHALAFLVESHRVLTEGGWLRLSTPNLDWVERHCQDRAAAGDRRRAGLELNRAFYGWGHRFLWNRDLLTDALEAAGFVDLSFHHYRKTGQPRLFAAIEQHETYPDTPEVPHVLIAEAQRGAAQPSRLAALLRELTESVVGPQESAGMLRGG